MFFEKNLDFSTWCTYFETQSTFMKTEEESIRDISEIRSLMERSTKFVSLTGLSGTLAGLYALLGAYLAYFILGFNENNAVF
jgi:hypothetical protein